MRNGSPIVVGAKVSWIAGLIAVSASVLGCASGAPMPQTEGAAPIARPFMPPDLTSGLQIPVGQTFALGGGQATTFVAEVRNEGTTVVLLAGELDGAQRSIGSLAPGQAGRYRLAVREGALLKNESSTTAAQLRVEVWGNPSALGMRYVANESSAAGDPVGR